MLLFKKKKRLGARPLWPPDYRLAIFRTLFIRSIDTSDIIKNSKKLYKLIDNVVKEIREENAVEVVTDSALAYVGAGKLLEEKRET